MALAWLSRQPWYNKFKQTAVKQPVIVYIEGNIGVGKSTLLKKLEEKGYLVVQEPVSQWTNYHGINFLELYTQDMQKWAFTFQSMVLSTLWQAQLEAIQQENPVIIAERSLHSVVKMFAKTQKDAGFMNEEQYVLLDNTAKTMVSQYKRKEYFIYLRGGVSTAYKRIHKRARDEESTLSKGYIQQLHLILDNWMENEPGLHAVVDATGSPETVQQQVIEALGQLPS
ncbi:deoxynucleoside kinase-like [Thrips palmi]|uniref:Deoxynucleoside kinase-like n=1 Tax=Thrips palmi TaxID=161013 RepID=A0A6P8Z535_THRPL|nr:deoxynucleoside kinase-like [Thrips palmi]